MRASVGAGVGAGVGVAVAVGCCLRRSKANSEDVEEETADSSSAEDKKAIKTVLLDTSSVEFDRSILSGSSSTLTSHQSNEYKFRPTEFGALSTRVFPESQSSKDKKMEKITPVAEAHAPLTRVQAVPLHEAPKTGKIKVVHFLRHGEGTSNSAARLRGKDQYKSTEWLDARLTELGKRQASDISHFVLTADLRVELVMVSPLRRATETGCLAFASRSAPFAACELLRERAHGNPCDRRCKRSQLSREFPAVDYSAIEEDDPFSEKRGELGESWLDTAERASKFLQVLEERAETHIAVVTHSAFLLTLFNIVLGEVDRSLHEWFETGELRSVVLVFPEA